MDRPSTIRREAKEDVEASSYVVVSPLFSNQIWESIFNSDGDWYLEGANYHQFHEPQTISEGNLFMSFSINTPPPTQKPSRSTKEQKLKGIAKQKLRWTDEYSKVRSKVEGRMRKKGLM